MNKIKPQIKTNKNEVYAILCGIATSSLIISNILAFKTFTVFDVILPCGVLVFPLVYIVDDVLAEVYGFTKARKVIYLGFIMNLIAVIMYNIAIMLPAPIFFKGSEAFALVLSNSLRVLIASFSAYFFGSLLNAYLMVYLKEKTMKNYLFLRCILSTLGGESLDAILFITIAFIGTMPIEALIGMVIAQTLFKTIYEVIVYPITRKVIHAIKKLN